MSTAELIGGRAGPPDGSAEGALATQPQRAMAMPVVLAGALLIAVFYAAFEHGAVALPADTRLEVAVAAFAAVAGAGWLWTGTLTLSAPRPAIVGVGMLAAFACWCGISVLWSVAPAQTWIELNRTITYAIVLCLAIAVGASYARAVELIARGFLAVALVVTVYALGQKLLPGLHVAGLFNLDQTGPLPRLQEPLGYWNALALFVTMGVPIALALAADARRSPRHRLAALCAVELMLLTIAFTFSRGGLLALAIALVVAVGLSGARLRTVMWLAAAALAAVPPLVLGLTAHSLTVTGVSLGKREAAGAVLALVLVASLAALVVAARRLLVLEPRVRIDPEREAGLRRLALAGAGVIVLGALLAVALSSRGLGGTASHLWHSFTATRTTSNTNPSRLLSADSENRWVWWKEAAGAFSARPITGWGAGSFGVLDLLYRRDVLTVQQPHSVPLQFLAETGVIGALLAIGAYVLLLRVAVRGIRRRAHGSERALAAALLAGVLAYGIHCLYDWDWDIPAVSLPAFMFLGVLVATRAQASGPALPRRPSWTARAAWLGGLTLWLCAFALSAALPSLAAGDASSALVQAADGSPAALRSARASAELASQLDPLSDAGLRAEATIAIHRGHLVLARAYLQDAVARNPTDAPAWDQLAFIDAVLGDRAAATGATQRAVALDPRGQSIQTLAQAELATAPPSASATATPTPLPAP